MAVYFHKDNIEFEPFVVTANVPNNDVALLMYYMKCVCTAINCNDDPDIQRFTNYNNWARLSIAEQRALVVVCYTFSPDTLHNRVFFQNDVLCSNSSNEFYTVNQVRNYVSAAESIIITGQVRVVNKIMTYKIQWMKTNYYDSMKRLVERVDAPPLPPSHPITYTSRTNDQPYRPPILQQPNNRSDKPSCFPVYFWNCITILCIISTVVGVIMVLKQKGTI